MIKTIIVSVLILVIIFVIYASNSARYLASVALDGNIYSELNIEKISFDHENNICGMFSFKKKITEIEFNNKFKLYQMNCVINGKKIEARDDIFIDMGVEGRSDWFDFSKNKIDQSYIDSSNQNEYGSGSRTYYFIDFKSQIGLFLIIM